MFYTSIIFAQKNNVATLQKYYLIR